MAFYSERTSSVLERIEHFGKNKVNNRTPAWLSVVGQGTTYQCLPSVCAGLGPPLLYVVDYQRNAYFLLVFWCKQTSCRNSSQTAEANDDSP